MRFHGWFGWLFLTVALLAGCAVFGGSRALPERVQLAEPRAVATDPGRSGDLVAEWIWNGDEAAPQVRNRGSAPVRVAEVVLWDLAHGLPATTSYYGEGLQMLAQYGGTLEKPVDHGDYPDRTHYRLPEPEGMRRVYSLLTLQCGPRDHLLFGFTSCRRFVGAFDVGLERLRCVVDTEGIELAPGAVMPLEGLMVLRGPDRGELLAQLGTAITHNHPRTGYPAPPTGWCSWYCFGPKVTADNVLANLAAMQQWFPALKFVQVDDGYQPTMGDWLDTGPGFGGRPVQEILQAIRTGGREPAIWVAPFIASGDSRILREHPDWFVQGEDGKPLSSDRVQFGGWRLGPWFVLDGTHPEVQRHFETLFATMRQQWGVTYFKLDATFWGMIRGGRFHDPTATRVEAYRRGMAAIRKGAESGSYLLGCNHPIWPSLGLIDGSRSSLDIDRNWRSVMRTGRENLLRGWQNGVLWWNDPDTLVTTGLPPQEARFHATLLHATGGAMLAGDDLASLDPIRGEVVRTLSRPTGVAASFADLSLETGVMHLPGDVLRYAVFNWSELPQVRRIEVPFGRRMRDVWTGTELGISTGVLDLGEIQPHSARLLDALPVGS